MKTTLLFLGLSLSSWAQAQSPEDRSAHFFRDIFHTEMQRSGGSGASRTEDFIFLPTPAVSRFPADIDASDPLKSLLREHAPIAVRDLYEYGLGRAPQPINQLDSIYEKSGPITIVIVPGIYGEFIDTRPFDEALSQGGSFQQQWRGSLAALTDSVYSLEQLGESEKGLDQLIDLASFDDEEGRNQVNLIYLKPLFGSLETLGSAEKINSIYLRRLSKVFEAIPAMATPHIYLLGYSRGAPYALDLIVKSRARAEKYPWASRVKGHIGLVGVYYGSESADDAYLNPKSAQFKAIQILNRLAQELEVSAGSPLVIARNSARWTGAFAQLATLSQELASLLPAEAVAELLQLGLPEPDLRTLLGTFGDVAFSLLKLDRPLRDYDGNIRRFKVLVRELNQGAASLSTGERLKWWRENVLPADIALYDVVGTMPDASRPGQGLSPLSELPGYASDSADYTGSLRSGFYTLKNISGTQLNDSQMTIARAHYWPEAAAVLNPRQVPLKSHLLAVMGTHHWGCSYPIVVKEGDGRVNAFPRSVLLKSIATFIAHKLVP